MVGDESVESGRGPGQLPWYEFAATIIRGKTVLDAGCGLGLGLEILRRSNKQVFGQDLDPRLERPGIKIGPLASIPSGKLCRVAKDVVFVTTPNWTITRCQWPYHIREYTPQELEELFKPFGSVALFKGNSSGSIVYPVRHARLYHVANAMRYGRYSSFVTRCLNKLMPATWRIHGHNAALISLGKRSGES